MKRSKWQPYIVLIGFLLLTVVYTFPLILHPDQYMHSVPAIDHGENYWNLWWVHHWATTPNTQLFFSDLIFYPEGVSLAFHALCLLNGLIALPFLSVLPISVVHNLLFFFSFVLTGYAVYLLAKEWGASDWSSWIVGIWFAFSSYRFGHWHHMNLFNTQWFVFYLWCFSRLMHRPSKWRGALCGLFLITVAWSSWYYLIFSGIASTVLLLIHYWRRPKDLRHLFGPVAIASAIFLTLFSPYLFEMVKCSRQSPPSEIPIGAATNFSVDLISMLLPKFIWKHLSFGERAFAFTSEIQDAIFPHPLLYGSLILLVLFQKRKERQIDWEWFWVAGICAVFSLGPLLKIGGLVSLKGHPVFLPGYLIQRFPMMSQFRVFDRFMMVTHLALMIFVAPHLESLLSLVSNKARLSLPRMKVLILFASLALAWHGTIPMSDAEPKAFFQLLARSDEDFTVAEVPFAIQKDQSQGAIAFHQTVHGKRIVIGSLSRIPGDLEARMSKYKIIALLLEYQDPKAYQLDERDFDDMKAEIEKMNLRYVVLHPEKMPAPPHNALRNVLVNRLGATLTASDIEVYRMRTE